ncbi:MAG: 50S ribosomal protein L10 [Verrucomicrobiae bacterium]|nr:50S ribosomal protein L10 [Verrucomicrobiae bacterium]
MRPEKKSITDEIEKKIAGSPFLILTDYTGLTVADFTELRKRLTRSKSRAVVVKNSILRLLLKKLGPSVADAALQGPTAVVYGEADISGAASAVRGFHKEFKKLRVKAGILDKVELAAEQVHEIADLPSIEVLRAKLLGLLMTPASSFVRLASEPAASFARLAQAKAAKST